MYLHSLSMNDDISQSHVFGFFSGGRGFSALVLYAYLELKGERK